jgi:hypothetical protein
MLTTRRYDIDWLRVIAIGLLLIYHISIGFQPWGVFIGFIQNNESLDWIWTPMSMLNIWRIPLLFFVSGMGVYFAIQRRNWKELITERSRRILIPFIFGMIAIVPLHIYLWLDYYNQDMKYLPNPAHLWFLGNIFIYVVIFSPLFFLIKKYPDGKFQKILNQLLSHPSGLLILMIPFIAEAEFVPKESFELYAMTWHGFWIGLVAFVIGFLCVASGMAFWKTVTKWRWLLLGVAVALYLIRLLLYDLNSPEYLKAIESNFWIFTVFGFGHRYLNKPGKALRYLSSAAYPVYIIHMVFLYLGSVFLFEIDIAAIYKFILLFVFTMGGCMLTYEFIISRVKFLKPLFGLK